ncbi:MAG: hypothetical protein V4850_08690 [Myxococcota bacterium]
MDTPDTIGLTRREMERHVQWVLRSPPKDHAALVALVSECIVTLLDKNNQAILRALADRREDG